MVNRSRGPSVGVDAPLIVHRSGVITATAIGWGGSPLSDSGPDVRGIIATCLTPFDNSGLVDYEALGREIDYIVDECHADAIAIAATEDAEYTMLEWAQRKELITRGTEMVRGRVPVTVGISHPAPERAIELAEHAKRAGADVAQLLLPLRLWGGDPTSDETHDYVSGVAAQCPLPLSVCQNRATGSDAAIPLFLRVAEIPTVHYLVEMSGDITRIGRLVEEVERRGSARYFTTIESLLINLTLGGSGAIMPPPAARIGGEVVRAFRAGEMDEAVEWQRMLSLFPGRWRRYGLPPVMKAAMRHLGIDLGQPMSPYGSVTDADDEAIARFWSQRA
jgi:4-hydroxy-tetrahydrodipicolinate synthase